MSARTLDSAPPLAALPVAPDTAPLVVRASGLPQEQIDVLKATICKALDENQLLLYLTICRKRGVDPFTEAFAFAQKDGSLAFGLRIDGMRALAMRTGEYVRREVEPVMVEGKMVGAVARIWRKGMEAPVVEEALFSEYKKTGFGWTQYPETMIRKVAESKAIRAAFPDALAGIYEPAEVQE